jgi:hypothetical protein
MAEENQRSVATRNKLPAGKFWLGNSEVNQQEGQP